MKVRRYAQSYYTLGFVMREIPSSLHHITITNLASDFTRKHQLTDKLKVSRLHIIACYRITQRTINSSGTLAFRRNCGLEQECDWI